MLMSDLIILGSMLRPQASGVLFDSRGGSCATGAAIEALGYSGDDIVNGRVDWTDLFRDHIVIQGEIARRNNTGQSRESIAVWLRASGNDFNLERLPENAPVCEAQTHAGGKLVVTT